METQPDISINFSYFLKKEVRIILTFSGSAKPISYRGEILSIEPNSLLFYDRMHGHVLITLKDISQILEVLP
jgi:hypothetical protein